MAIAIWPTHHLNHPYNVFLFISNVSVATAEDSDSPVAMKLKKMWLKTPVSEEQAAQAVLDPAIGNYYLITHSLNVILNR